LYASLRFSGFQKFHEEGGEIIMGAFYFRSYNRIIGKASDVRELAREMSRLDWENPAAVVYHLKQGHIAVWLESIGEKELADELRNVTTIGEARTRIEKRLERSVMVQRMQTGRMH
jgi:hypothetical protein